MAVDDEDALKAMPCQRQHHVVEHSQQGGGLQAHRARKTQVMLSHAKGLGGGHQHAAAPAYLKGHRFSG